MPGEVFMNGNLSDALAGAAAFAQHGAAGTKGAVVGVGGLLATGAAVAFKKHAGGGGAEHGRVKRVEQGQLGLREHNNKYYKLVPVIVDGKPVLEKRFFELMQPGLRIAPVPWFKYKLLNTQNDQVDLDFKDKRVLSKDKRLFDLSGGVTWGHILGFDENRQRIPYEYSNGRSVSVEQLVFNGIMAAKTQAEVGRQVSSMVEPVIWRSLYGSRDPVEESQGLFELVRRATHDRLLDLGAELRELNLTASPNVLDHFGHIGMASVSGLIEHEQPSIEDLTAIEQAVPGTVPDLHVVHSGAAQ
jgi:hypothetical protein